MAGALQVVNPAVLPRDGLEDEQLKDTALREVVGRRCLVRAKCLLTKGVSNLPFRCFSYESFFDRMRP